MIPALDIASLILKQSLSPQTLRRVPEPESVTTDLENVRQYGRVLMTRFPIAYALALEMIDRALPPERRRSALDLASGPGLFTALLARHLGFQEVRGLDLSSTMVEAAGENARVEKVSNRVEFRQADITRLSGFKENEADLSCFTFGAHHMPDLGVVKSVLEEMDRVTRPDGLVFLMDGVRPRTKGIVEHYMKSIGYEFLELGLGRIFEDLRHSLLAAWTEDEMLSAVPGSSKRRWCQWVPFGFPISQFLVGYPIDRESPLRRPSRAQENPLIRELYPRWEASLGESWARETSRLWNLSHALLFSPLGKRRFRRLS